MILTQILLLTALASAPFWLLYAQGSYEKRSKSLTAKTRWFSQNRFAERRLWSWLCAAMSRCAAAELATCSSAPF
jgi:hypothetical protein